MIHLTNKVKSILKELKTKGFNGIRFEVLELENCYWNPEENYVAFIAQPRFPSYEESPYVDIDISVTKFEEDFRAFLKEQLGADVKLGYSDGCFEWECYR